VGLEPRNTFKGDSYQTLDLRLSRQFKAGDRFSVEAIAEAFNLFIPSTSNISILSTARRIFARSIPRPKDVTHTALC